MTELRTKWTACTVLKDNRAVGSIEPSKSTRCPRWHQQKPRAYL